jgi:hypothetical protein
MRKSGAHLWVPSVLGATACGIFLLTHLSQPWIVAGEPTALLVPCLASLVILVAGVADATIMFVKSRAVVAAETTDTAKPDVRRLAWYLGALLAFAVLMKPLGFIPLVIIVFPLLLICGERVAVRKALAITSVTGLIVYIVFERLLAVDLPQGTLFSTWS